MYFFSTLFVIYCKNRQVYGDQRNIWQLLLQTLKNAQKRTHVWEFYESYLRLVSGNLVQRQFTVNSNAFMIVWLKRKSKRRLVNELLMNTVNTVQDLFSKEGVWHPTYDFSAAISGINCRHGLGQKGFLFCKFITSRVFS